MEGDAGNLELGQEVEYTLASRTCPGGKVSAENVRLLAKGTLPMPKVSVVCFFLERPLGKCFRHFQLFWIILFVIK